jgi:hypothetical protein
MRSFEMWCWRKRGNISWTDRVKNEKVLQRVKKESCILHTLYEWVDKWIGQIFRRNCLLKHVIGGKKEGRIEVTGRRERKRKQPLDYHKEKRGCWKVKEAALDCTVWEAMDPS